MKVFIQTYGCAFNQADSKFMKNLLEDKGKTIVSSPEEADIIIINSCSVKNEAETKLFRFIRQFKDDKKIIVSGCVPEAEPSYAETKLKEFSLLGTGYIDHINEVVEKTFEGERVVLLGKRHVKRVARGSLSRNKVIEIVPINEGCLGNCDFCKTKQARYDLYSYAPGAIVRHIRSAVKEGKKEFWLTSQDTGAYGLDIKTNLPSLLKDILEGVSGKYFIRVGMLNPNFSYRFREELFEVYQHPNMFKFLHIPVQSGSPKVLREMKRPHTLDHYLKSVEYFREKDPLFTIATDIIVAYPGETEEDFNLTLELVKKTSPDVMNISRFWARPGTKAAEKEQIPGDVSKERSKKLRALFEKIARERNVLWKGWEGIALVDEEGKNETLIARNPYYKQIILKKEEGLFGKFIKVKVKRTRTFDLVGDIIEVLN